MDHDVVLFGATGFAGNLVAEYLASHPSRTSFSWAIAGRSPEKLAALRSSLAGAAPEIIVTDTADRPSIDAMVSKARVVITTAGHYGEKTVSDNASWEDGKNTLPSTGIPYVNGTFVDDDSKVQKVFPGVAIRNKTVN